MTIEAVKLTPREAAILQSAAVRRANLKEGTTLGCRKCFARLGRNHIDGIPDSLITSVCQGFDQEGNPVEDTSCMLTSEE